MASYLDDGSFDGLSKAEDPFFISTYLDSPILCTVIEKFQDGVKYWKDKGLWPVTIGMKKHLREAPLYAKEAYNIMLAYGKTELPPDLNVKLYPLVSHLSPTGYTSLPDLVPALSLSSEIFHDSCAGLEDWLKENASTEVRKKPFKLGFSPSPLPEEEYWYSRWGYWDTLTETAAAGFSAKKHFALQVDMKKAGSCITNAKVALLNIACQDHQTLDLILSWDQIMMFKDLCYSRAQVYTAARVLYPDKPNLITAISETIKWHEECLTRYGNHGFEILKQTESLAKAYLSLCSGDKFGDDGPYGRMVIKVEQKERGIGLRGDQKSLASTFLSVLELVPEPKLVTEIFGLQKISGHPVVDPREGGRTVKEISCAPSQAGFSDSQRLRWNFCRMFLESYVPRRGWPDLVFSDKTTKLYQLYSLQRRNLDRFSYPLTDWQTCTFGRLFDFDYSPNYLDLMDDKAISQYRSNIASNWDKEIPAVSQRRLLLELLSREDVDPKAIIRRIMRRDIPREWLIVCLYPKEREFKISPRMFAMMVFEMRLAWTLLETNLADNVFKYLPQQTMTKDRLETLKLFLDLSKPSYSEDTLHMFLEMDLSTWCQKWRAPQVNPIAEVIEDMFDMPGAFTYIHEFFTSSMMVIRTGDLRPTGIELASPPPSDLVYYNDLGGKEGIQQKLWTVCTASMIDLGLNQFPVSYRLIGQADNQVVSVHAPYDRSYPVKNQLLSWRDKLLASIDLSCRAVNQDLKPNECLESTTVITYSKDVYVNGVIYPTSLKFHSRLFPHSSQDFPSVRTNIGAIFSTALAGAERSTIPIRSYYLSLLQAAIYLERISRGIGLYGSWLKNQLRGLSPPEKRDALYTLLILPSDLGGLPVPTVMSFVYKGGADPLAKSLSGLILLRRRAKNRVCDRLLSQLEVDEIYSKDPEILSLLKDPYSIPLTTPPTAIDKATESTVEAFLPRVINRDIRQLLDSSTEEYIGNLVTTLGNVRPFNPLVLRDVLECSVYGISSTIKKMFVATRTIQTVSRLTNPDIIMDVLASEKDSIAYVLKRYSTLPKSPWQPEAVHSLCLKLRSRWSVGGIPFPEGVTSYSPLDFSIILGERALCTTGLHAVLIGEGSKAQETRGPFDPYLGSKTKEKRSEHGYKIVDSDTTSESFRKLQRILSQTKGNLPFQHLIDCVGLSRSKTILSTITENLDGVAGGLWVHRYDSISGHQEAYSLGCPTIYTHCLISSDHSGKLSGGAYDYNIMLQPHFLTLLWGLSYLVSAGFLGDLALAIDTESVELAPLPAIKMELPQGISIPVTSFKGNKLAFLSDIRVDRTGVALRQVPQLNAKFRGSEFRLEKERDRRMVLEGWFLSKMRLDSGGRQAADGKHLSGFGVSMDIAEVIANGLQSIVVAMAGAIADHFLLNSLRTIDTARERWNMVTFVSSVADPLVRSVSVHLGHPAVRADPTVRKFQLFDSPVYRPTHLRAHDRLRGIVVGESLKRIAYSAESYALRVTASFSMTVGFTDIEALLMCTARVLNHLVVQKLIRAKDRRHVVKTFLMQVLRLPIDSPSKLAALDVSLAAIAKWLSSRKRYAAEKMIKDISSGRLLQYFRIDPSEALKHTRVLNPDPLTFKPAFRRKGPKMSKEILDCCFQVRTVSPTGVEPGQTRDSRMHRCTTIRERTPMERLQENTSRYPGSPSSTFSILMELQSMFEGRTVLAVGVGEGYTCAAAALSGARLVVGLELQVDLPLRAHRFMDYIPPAVLSVDMGHLFRLHTLCILSSGDWFDQKVSERVCETLADDPVIVFDIESGYLGSFEDMLKPLEEIVFDGTIIARLMLDSLELRAVVELLRGTKMKFRVILISNLGTNFVVLVVITECKWPMYQKQAEVNISPPLRVLTGMNYDDLKPRELRLSDAVLNIIDIPNGLKVSSIRKMIEWMVLEEIGDPINRLSYEAWTTLVHAYISAVFLDSPECKRKSFLTEWKEEALVTLPLGRTMLRFSYPHNLMLHLTSTVAKAIDP